MAAAMSAAGCPPSPAAPGVPVTDTSPASHCTSMSYARLSAYGPTPRIPEMSTATSRGCAAHRVAASSPSRAAAPGRGSARTRRRPATSRRTTSSPRGSFEVEGEGLLAPVAPHEVRGETAGGGVVAAREVAAVDPLDLDDAGAEVGELPGGERRGDGLFDGDDGECRLRGRGSMRGSCRVLGPRAPTRPVLGAAPPAPPTALNGACLSNAGRASAGGDDVPSAYRA